MGIKNEKKKLHSPANAYMVALLIQFLLSAKTAKNAPVTTTAALS